MKLHQHAFAPLWPHFGTPVSTYPIQMSYPYKRIQPELKGIYNQQETILPALRRIRQAADFEAEAESWQMLCALLRKVLHDMPRMLDTTPTVYNLQRLIHETTEALEEIPRELQRLEAENYYGYAPAILDVQEIVGFPHAMLENNLPPDICPPGGIFRIDRDDFHALHEFSRLKKEYPMLGGGCGLTRETAIILPKEVPHGTIGMSHKIFSALFDTKGISQCCITYQSRTYDVLQSKKPYHPTHVLWFDITEHWTSR